MQVNKVGLLFIKDLPKFARRELVSFAVKLRYITDRGREREAPHAKILMCVNVRSTAGCSDQHVAAMFLLQRSEEHTSELQSQSNLVCRLLLEKKKKKKIPPSRSEYDYYKQLYTDTRHG